jgi:outer membrane protein assembly factor BamB
MREGFVTRLELQLTKAERLQEHGSRLSRLLAPLWASRPSPAAGVGLAAAAAVLIAVVVGAVALTRGGDTDTVVGHRPAVVARTQLSPDPSRPCVSACEVADPYMALASGFGSAWIGGVEHGELVRLDAGTHRVVARIPVGKLPSGIVTTPDAVWVLTTPRERSATLVRVDPTRNRVTDRVPVPAPAEAVVPTLLGDERALWVLGWDSGVRYDLSRGAVAGRVTWNFAGGAFARGFGLAGDDLWVRAEDGQLLHFSAHTGERLGRASSPHGVATLAVIPDTGVVVANADGTLTRIDASNGRVRWTAHPAEGSAMQTGSGRTDGTVAIAGRTVWAFTLDGRRGTERLTAIDLATGRTLTATALNDLGAGWMKPVGDELWYLAPTSHAVVVRP